MNVVVDTNIILDFLDGIIEDPYALIKPYRLIFLSPVTFHEVLRAYPEEYHEILFNELKHELLPPPKLEHWVESAQILRKLFFRRKEKNIAKMQNDILIALAARDSTSPIWSRDEDFQLISDYLKVHLIQA